MNYLENIFMEKMAENIADTMRENRKKAAKKRKQRQQLNIPKIENEPKVAPTPPTPPTPTVSKKEVSNLFENVADNVKKKKFKKNLKFAAGLGVGAGALYGAKRLYDNHQANKNAYDRYFDEMEKMAISKKMRDNPNRRILPIVDNNGKTRLTFIEQPHYPHNVKIEDMNMFKIRDYLHEKKINKDFLPSHDYPSMQKIHRYLDFKDAKSILNDIRLDMGLSEASNKDVAGMLDRFYDGSSDVVKNPYSEGFNKFLNSENPYEGKRFRVKKGQKLDVTRDLPISEIVKDTDTVSKPLDKAKEVIKQNKPEPKNIPTPSKKSTFNLGKAGKIGAGVLGAGALAYGAKKMYDKRQSEKAAYERYLDELFMEKISAYDQNNMPLDNPLKALSGKNNNKRIPLGTNESDSEVVQEYNPTSSMGKMAESLLGSFEDEMEKAASELYDSLGIPQEYLEKEESDEMFLRRQYLDLFNSSNLKW